MGAPAVRKRGSDAGLPSETHHTDKSALGARRKVQRSGRDEPPVPEPGERPACSRRGPGSAPARRAAARPSPPLPRGRRAAPAAAAPAGPAPASAAAHRSAHSGRAPPDASPRGAAAPRLRLCPPPSGPLRRGDGLCNLVSAALFAGGPRFAQAPRLALWK